MDSYLPGVTGVCPVPVIRGIPGVVEVLGCIVNNN